MMGCTLWRKSVLKYSTATHADKQCTSAPLRHGRNVASILRGILSASFSSRSGFCQNGSQLLLIIYQRIPGQPPLPRCDEEDDAASDERENGKEPEEQGESFGEEAQEAKTSKRKRSRKA